MARARWTLAWAFWSLAVGLALWGAWDAPRRGETGLLMRGERVGSVLADSPVARDGMVAPGDRIELPGEETVTARARLAHVRAGETVHLLVTRPGDPRPRAVSLVARSAPPETLSWRLAWSAVALGLLLLACAVGRARRDRLALVFFLWCTVTSVAVTPWPLWPAAGAAEALEASASAAALLLPVLLLHFFALFPEGRGRRRTRVAAVLYGAVVLFTLGAPLGAHFSATLGEVVAAASGIFFALAVGLAIASFAISYGSASARHRRRLHVLLWCAILGLGPVVALTVQNNLSSRPAPAPVQAAALLFLLVPAGFAYAIEVHQIFDFRWRRSSGSAGRASIPSAPPVFGAGDARATVHAVAADLHTRLGLTHCCIYWRSRGNGLELATWLGDPPREGGLSKLSPEVAHALERLRRPASLEELRALSDDHASAAVYAQLERSGTRTLMPLFASQELRAVLALGGRLADDLSTSRRRAELGGYMEHAALAVEHAEFHDDRVLQARVERELELARSIQERLLPRRDPVFPTFASSGASVPSGRVCGDYFDYVDLGDRRFGVAVADVCGKGVPAALLVSHVQAGLRLRAAGGTAPAQVLAGLNQDLASFHQPEKFVCLFYAVVDARARTVRWANAGLNPPLRFRADGEVHELPCGDLILGVDAGTTYEERSERLAPGEGLVIHTDGILDARSGEEVFGGARFLETVSRGAGLRAPRLRDRILTAARAFHTTGPADDMTAVVLKAL